MIHVMATATVRDLRTRFPKLKALIARDGEVIVTHRGTPAYVLRPYSAPPPTKVQPLDYFGRLKSRQPRPISRRAARALDEADRGER
jgi:antitoxin (DNA-binding transcriptional repressor) of toxin-antitoxin stability system